MHLKAVIFKVSCNSDNVFNLRKEPDKLLKLIYDRVKECPITKKDKNSYTYEFQILNEISENNKSFLFGRVIKYQELKEVEKWDNEKKDIVKEISENDINDKVYFIYSRDEEYFIVEDRSQLKIETFKEVVTYLLNFNNLEFQVELNYKLSKHEIKNRILKLKKITWAHFEIIPNNPSGSTWNNFENIGEKLNSTASEYKFSNKENGLVFNDMMEELVDDVNEGRGRRFIVAGREDDKKYQEIRSHDHIKRYYTDVESSVKGRVGGLWKIVKEVIDL